MFDMEFLEHLKTFLSDRPEAGLLAISLVVNALLFVFYVRARDSHVKSLEAILPLATRLSDMLSLAATKARARNGSPDGMQKSSDIGRNKD